MIWHWMQIKKIYKSCIIFSLLEQNWYELHMYDVAGIEGPFFSKVWNSNYVP